MMALFRPLDGWGDGPLPSLEWPFSFGGFGACKRPFAAQEFPTLPAGKATPAAVIQRWSGRAEMAKR